MTAAAFIAASVIAAAAVIRLSDKPFVSERYYAEQITGGELEERYAALGAYPVASKEYEAGRENGRQRHFKVWYPVEDGQYPLVVMNNGTDLPYQEYEAVFYHLASWGFVVIGNDYEFSWDGAAASMSLDFALGEEEIVSRVDTNWIGMGGYSQGGVGVFNSITEFDNGILYKAAFVLSPTNQGRAISKGWNYDPTDVYIPFLMLAGTGNSDAQTIIPLTELKRNYDDLPDTVSKVAARRIEADHKDMLVRGDPYATAWLLYWLQDDTEAGKSFWGNEAELCNNPLWQDTMIAYYEDK